MYTKISDELKNGDTVLYLGMGIFEDAQFEDGSSIPFDSDSMILTLNDGRPMSARLMYEYSRAAMDIEQSIGRKALEQKLDSIFSKKIKNCAANELVKKIKPKYIIDTNYDTTIQGIYEDVPHSVILGKARIGAEHDRFEIYEYDVATKKYEKISKEFLRLDFPIIFKPMGSVLPVATFIISDADFVDWITEAMGGFAMPKSLKEYREGKKYLMLGFAFDKDTQRMVANELTFGLDSGYFVCDKELTKNGSNFLTQHKLELVASDTKSFCDNLLQSL